jgi:hypothetical protein
VKGERGVLADVLAGGDLRQYRGTDNGRTEPRTAFTRRGVLLFTFHFSPDRNPVYCNPLAPGLSPALSGVGIVPPFYEPVKLWFGRLQ